MKFSTGPTNPARADLNDGLRAVFSGLGRAIGDSLQVLHRIEWSAPWDAPKKPPVVSDGKARSAD